MSQEVEWRYQSGAEIGTMVGQQAYDEEGDCLGMFLFDLSDPGTPEAEKVMRDLVEGPPIGLYPQYAGQRREHQVRVFSVRVVCTPKHSRVRQALIRSIDGTPAWVNAPDLKLGSM